MRFSVYQVSRKGGREKNEDRMGYCYTRDAGLFALADGMGGHPEGEVAAQLALQTLAASFQRDADPQLAEPIKHLKEAILAGHQQLLRYATERALVDTPRTTIVACLIQGQTAYWAHCGDSRLYLVRAGRIIARTRDHSYSELQEALNSVVPTNERFNRNVLFTCLGSPGKPVIDVAGPTALQRGDRVLLCSDGLWGSVPDDDIAMQMTGRPIAQGVPDLVESALRNAGPKSDNVTVLCVDWESAEDRSSTHGGIDSQQLDDDAFASTIQPHGGEPVDDIDDDEIERTIHEINEAIRRTGKKKAR
jgi:PPM family protein phosphatase